MCFVERLRFFLLSTSQLCCKVALSLPSCLGPIIYNLGTEWCSKLGLAGVTTRKVEPGKVLGADEVSEEVGVRI
jgi:hypothetical protein